MNMQHDFRYVTQGDVDSFGGWKQRNLAWYDFDSVMINLK
jgi:hypothetical protein